MDVRPAEHGGQVHWVSRQTGRAFSEILDFSANINPLGPPASVKAALVQALDDIRFYPDSSHYRVKYAIAERYGISVKSILVSNGATEAIDLTLRSLHPQRVMIMEPAFSEYRAAAHRHHLALIALPLLRPDFTPPWDLLNDTARSGDLVIWNNPHNPSGGRVLHREFTRRLAELAGRGVSFLIDESFIDFLVDMGDTTALLEALDSHQKVVVVRSLTKFLAIPGLRFGYALAHPDTIEAIEEFRDRWSVSHLAQEAAIAGLGDATFTQETQAWLLQSMQQVQDLWGSVPECQLQPTSVNFFLVRWNDEALSRRLAFQLLKRGIIVRLCEGFSGLGASYWRLAIRSPKENSRLYQAVQDALEEVRVDG